MNIMALIPGVVVVIGAISLAVGCAQPATPSPTAASPPAAPTAAPEQTVAPTRPAPPTQATAPTRAATPAPTLEPAVGGTPTAGVIVVPGATSQVPPLNATPIPTPVGAGPAPDIPDAAKGLLAKARADAAQRAGVTADEVIAVRVEEVEWRDGSLGCPQPGMMYPQVITPGYLFILEAGGNRYEYHADRDSRVFLCGQP